MGFEAEEEPHTAATLPLYSAKAHISNIESSPLHTLASVPFCWEDEPGRPKHSTSTLSTDLVTHKGLELPPRLLITKLSSPSSALGSPYSMVRPRRSDSSSLRMMVMGGECYGSSRRNDSLEHGDAEGKQHLGGLVLAGRRGQRGDLGFVGLWKRKWTSRGNTQMSGASYVFPSSIDTDHENSMKRKEISGSDNEATMRITRTSTAEGYLGRSPSKSHFWASVCEGLKQVVPWRSKKMKRGSF